MDSLRNGLDVCTANVRYDDPQEKVQKKEVPNPEKAAQRRTDEMDKALNLTEK